MSEIERRIENDQLEKLLRFSDSLIMQDCKNRSRVEFPYRTKLLELSRDNAIINTFISAWHSGMVSWENAVTQMAIVLCQQNEELMKVATKHFKEE